MSNVPTTECAAPAAGAAGAAIQVLLADDHAVLRAGLRLLLEAQPDLTVVGEAGDGEAAIELVRALRPDVVVLDIGMPGLNGLEALRRIKAQRPDVAVLILTMHANEAYLFEVIRAGGAGYVLKQTADTELLAAIRAAARGEPFLYPSMEDRLLKDFVWRARRARAAANGGGPRRAYQELTEREREVLTLVAEGHTSQQIADRLVVSAKTVETHRAHIMNKLGVSQRADLVRYALRHGYLTPTD